DQVLKTRRNHSGLNDSKITTHVHSGRLTHPSYLYNSPTYAAPTVPHTPQTLCRRLSTTTLTMNRCELRQPMLHFLGSSPKTQPLQHVLRANKTSITSL